MKTADHSGVVHFYSPTTMAIRILLALLLAIVAHIFVPAVPARSSVQAEPRELTAGAVVSRELSGGGSHSYKLELPANQFLQVLVQQEGIDVELLVSLNGRQLSKVDRPNGSRGRETISVITPQAGSYLLTIKSYERVSAKGRYELNVNQLREPRDLDLTWIAAEQRISEAELLRSELIVTSLRSSIQVFNSAAEFWRRLNQPYEEAVALYGSGMSSSSLGDNQEALDYLHRALQLFGNDSHGRSITMAAMGWPYMYLGNNEEAELSFLQAYKGFQSDGNIRGEGITLYGLAWIHALRGQNQQAYRTFSLALARRRLAQDRRGEAITLAGIGKVEARRGRYVEAISSLNESLRLLPERDDYARADTLSNLGWVYSALGNHSFALEYFKRALPLRERVGDRIGEATTLFGISVTERTLGHLNNALAAIDSAVEIIEKLRMVGTNQQLRISYFASVQDYYDFYIGLLMQLHKIHPSAGFGAKALHVYERGTARGLIDLLTEAQIDLREGVDASLLEEERRLDDMIDTTGTRRYQLLSRAHSSEEAKKLSQQVTELAAQHDALQARIRAKNPRYADIARPRSITAAEIQQLIDDDTLLLEYALGNGKSYIWAVTRAEVICLELPSRGQIERVAHPTYQRLLARNSEVRGETDKARRARLTKDDAAVRSGLEDLSRILLAPIAERLQKKRIVVVTQGVLQFIPFAALPNPASFRPLVLDHELLLLPSATTLLALRNQRQTRTDPSKTLTVIADPVYSSTDSRLPAESVNANGNSHRNQKEFPRLLSSLWEAKRIASHVASGESKVLLNFAANRTAFVNENLAEFRLLHIAAHALIDDAHPQLSGIVLSTVDPLGKPEDGFLRSNAIFKLKLSADLVVLSACRTGLGKDFKGEGLVGLTRAFMYAGSQRLMVSLWDVEDRATSELMVRFYDGLLGPEKLSPTAALRKAQIELLNDPRWKSPYYWAPFVLQGEW
jgi:CHAT domain-containing protein/Tfp pilus assembly protein PilF